MTLVSIFAAAALFWPTQPPLGVQLVDVSANAGIESCHQQAGCVLPPDASGLWRIVIARWTLAQPLGKDIYLHELGHVFDLSGRLTDDDRAAFATLGGQPGRAWWGGLNPPGERFAEAFRLCAEYGAGYRPALVSEWSYGWLPSRRVHLAACRLIRQAMNR